MLAFMELTFQPARQSQGSKEIISEGHKCSEETKSGEGVRGMTEHQRNLNEEKEQPGEELMSGHLH